MDLGDNRDDLIDRFAIEIRADLNVNVSQDTYNGVFEVAALEVSFHVACQAGFTGDDCDVNINDCEGISCGPRQVCVDGVRNFTCMCDGDYVGPDCAEVTVDEKSPSIIPAVLGTVAFTVTVCLLAAVVIVIVLTKSNRKKKLRAITSPPISSIEHDYNTLVSTLYNDLLY